MGNCPGLLLFGDGILTTTYRHAGIIKGTQYLITWSS